jgi:hypothetical protein
MNIIAQTLTDEQSILRVVNGKRLCCILRTTIVNGKLNVQVWSGNGVQLTDTSSDLKDCLAHDIGMFGE